jgi:membrane protein implicated in regulation of membrane protease activity
LSSLAPASKFLQTAVLGGVGYLMLSAALLEIIILASIGAISMASLAVAFGVAVNLLIGYGLSHLWGVQYAAVGLLAGSAVVLWISNAAVRRVLRHPDYHYSIS